MIVELISTGSELLLGDTVNTNVSWLAQELNKLGYTIAHQSVVGDNPKRMAEVFQLASTRADIVISTGGLGPTQGDITRNVLADSTVLYPMRVGEKHNYQKGRKYYITLLELLQVSSLKMATLRTYFYLDLLEK